MMILPLADALQNCFQNLTSRIAGIDNEEMTNRAIGMGSIIGSSLGAIKEQFKTPFENNPDKINNLKSSLKGFVTRAKSIMIPSTNSNGEKDYNGNTNPIKNIEKKSLFENLKENKSKIKVNPKKVASGILRTGYNVSKGLIQTGSSLAEGKFNNNSYKKNKSKTSNYISNFANEKKAGDKNEH